MNNTQHLPGIEPKQRKPPRVMMHVDAVSADGWHVSYRCSKCDKQTGWQTVTNVSEAKRGIPCPKCNEVK